MRHKDIGINNEGVKDKFRIHISEHGHRTVIGKKIFLHIRHMHIKNDVPITIFGHL